LLAFKKEIIVLGEKIESSKVNNDKNLF